MPSVPNAQSELTCWHVAFLSHNVHKGLLKFEGEEFINCPDYIGDTQNETIVLDSEATVIDDDSPSRLVVDESCHCE